MRNRAWGMPLHLTVCLWIPVILVRQVSIEYITWLPQLVSTPMSPTPTDWRPKGTHLRNHLAEFIELSPLSGTKAAAGRLSRPLLKLIILRDNQVACHISRWDRKHHDLSFNGPTTGGSFLVYHRLEFQVWRLQAATISGGLVVS